MPENYKPIKDLISETLEEDAILELVKMDPETDGAKRRNLVYVVNGKQGRKNTEVRIPFPFRGDQNMPPDANYILTIFQSGDIIKPFGNGVGKEFYTHYRVVERNPPKN